MSIDDTYIVKQLKADTAKGFALLVKRYTEPIYWHIRRMVVSHDDAQDAMQETFIRIYRSVGNYDEIRSLSAWIYKIATHEALRIIGQRKQDEVSADDRMALLDERAADSYIDTATPKPSDCNVPSSRCPTSSSWPSTCATTIT